MSEFQYYEFVAIDRPLTPAAQQKLRAITSRATITSTQLVNTYEWGDFKGDPHALVSKYFDAFLYYANWGTRRLILRIPTAQLNEKVVRQYCPVLKSRSRRSSGVAAVTIVDAHFVIDLWSEDESGGNWSDPDPGSLSALVPIRNELIAGDYRALHLRGGFVSRRERSILTRRPHPRLEVPNGRQAHSGRSLSFCASIPNRAQAESAPTFKATPGPTSFASIVTARAHAIGSAVTPRPVRTECRSASCG